MSTRHAPPSPSRRSDADRATRPARSRPLDVLIGLVLATAWVVTLMLTDGMGFTRDESFYFNAARSYAGWFDELEQNIEQKQLRESFTQEGIDRHWHANPEHPVLMKTLFALSDRHLNRELGWLTPSEAMRLPGMLSAGLLIFVIWLFALDLFERRLAALAAALSLALLPRLFFHSHLTCFDVPITSVWVLFIWAWWRSLRSTAWGWTAGLCWGIALITKLNAFFLPFVILGHWLVPTVLAWRSGEAPPPWRREDGSLRWPRFPLAFYAMAVLGPLIFLAGWPRHWFETFPRIGWYLNFHLRHEHYFENYFGTSLWEPPFPVEFPFVMTAVTTPIVFLFLFALGAAFLLAEAWRRWRSTGSPFLDERASGLLITLNILIPFLIIARPSTPIFGGVKHWFPALPFMALVVGYAVLCLHDALAERWPKARHAIASGLLACLVVPMGLATASAHPFGNAYYNELVGGLTGAADRQAMRQFWGYTSRQALPFINEHFDPQVRIYMHDTTRGSTAMYQEEALLRRDIVPLTRPQHSTCTLFDEQKAFAPLEYELWTQYRSSSPVFVATRHGVPMATIYCESGRIPGPEPDPLRLPALSSTGQVVERSRSERRALQAEERAEQERLRRARKQKFLDVRYR